MKGMMAIKEYAYIRVSTADQNEDRQLDAMGEERASCAAKA